MQEPRLDFLVGANLHFKRSAVRVRLEWDTPDERFAALPTAEVRQSLLAAMPVLAPAVFDAGGAGAGVNVRVPRGIDLAALTLRICLDLLREVAAEPPDDGVSLGGDDRRCELVFVSDAPEIAQAAMRLSLGVMQHFFLLADAATPSAAVLRQPYQDYLRFVGRRAPATDTRYMIEAARQRRLPVTYLGEQLIVFGHGRRQRQMQLQMTDRTGHLAFQAASNKRRANEILGQAGLPVPRQGVATDARAATRCAEQLGYPVVIKPIAADFGVGVSVGVMNAAGVDQAFRLAMQQSPAVIIEQYIEGDDHRLLVVNGELIAATRRVPAHVIGDGVHSIAQLVETANLDPRRGRGKSRPMTRMQLDDGVLARLQGAGYAPDSIPKPDEQVFLQRMGNLSSGGISVDVTDIVHPDNAALAETAALAIGLDIAGVDFLTTDISRSWREAGGGICEINPSPGVRLHYAPAVGQPRDVAGPVLRMLFPDDAPAGIPTAALTGSNGKTTTARMLAHILKRAGATVGMVCTEGVYIDGHCIDKGDKAGGTPARMMMLNPRIDAAVLEIARGALLRYGAGIESCDVAAVLNVADEHLGEHGVMTLEDLARVKRLLVELARDTVVLNADDPLCVAMAARSRATHLCYVSIEAPTAFMTAHIAAGGRAVMLETIDGEPWIVLHDGGGRKPLSAVGDLPATWGGLAGHNLVNAMFAAAMAHALGHPVALIGDALRGFHSDATDNMGRLNRRHDLPFDAIVDYCHNRHGLTAIGKLADGMQVKGRRLLTFSLPGNRRDADFMLMAREAAKHFDEFYLTPESEYYQRGRSADEIIGLLREGLLAAGVEERAIHITRDIHDCVNGMVSAATPGDLLLFTSFRSGEIHAELDRVSAVLRHAAEPVV
jgi:cyanophycin synthetase